MLEELEKRIQKIAERYQTKNATAVRVGVGDAEVAEYASSVEHGWIKTATPELAEYLSAASGREIKVGTKLTCSPRPFFRATFAAENKKWQALFSKSVVALGVEGALSKTGLAMQSDIQNTIASGGTSKTKFEPRHKLTMQIYAREAGKHLKDGSPGNYATTQPLVLTGALLESIQYELI